LHWALLRVTEEIRHPSCHEIHRINVDASNSPSTISMCSGLFPMQDFDEQGRVSLTVDERHDLADGAADLAEGSGGIGESRASGSSGLGKTLLSLGGSLGGLLRGG